MGIGPINLMPATPLLHITDAQLTLRILVFQPEASARRAEGLVNFDADPDVTATAAEVAAMKTTHASTDTTSKALGNKMIKGEYIDPDLAGLMFTEAGGISMRNDHPEWRKDELFALPIVVNPPDYLEPKEAVSLHQFVPSIQRPVTLPDYQDRILPSIDFTIMYRVMVGDTNSFFDCRYQFILNQLLTDPFFGHFGTIKESPELFTQKIKVFHGS